MSATDEASAAVAAAREKAIKAVFGGPLTCAPSYNGVLDALSAYFTAVVYEAADLGHALDELLLRSNRAPQHAAPLLIAAINLSATDDAFSELNPCRILQDARAQEPEATFKPSLFDSEALCAALSPRQFFLATLATAVGWLLHVKLPEPTAAPEDNLNALLAHPRFCNKAYLDLSVCLPPDLPVATMAAATFLLSHAVYANPSELAHEMLEHLKAPPQPGSTPATTAAGLAAVLHDGDQRELLVDIFMHECLRFQALYACDDDYCYDEVSARFFDLFMALTPRELAQVMLTAAQIRHAQTLLPLGLKDQSPELCTAVTARVAHTIRAKDLIGAALAAEARAFLTIKAEKGSKTPALDAFAGSLDLCIRDHGVDNAPGRVFFNASLAALIATGGLLADAQKKTQLIGFLKVTEYSKMGLDIYIVDGIVADSLAEQLPPLPPNDGPERAAALRKHLTVILGLIERLRPGRPAAALGIDAIRKELETVSDAVLCKLLPRGTFSSRTVEAVDLTCEEEAEEDKAQEVMELE